MKLWCDRCHEAVEPEVHREYDIPNANVGGYEVEELYICPICGSEVYQDPGTCVICGEPIDPDSELCDNCREKIAYMIDDTFGEYDRQNVLDGLTIYADQGGAA